MSNKAALLIIDAQLNMFAEDFSVYRGKEILQTINRLIEKARETETAVIFVRNNGPVGEPDEPHTPGWEIHPALNPLPNDISLDKTTADTFASTTLQQILEEKEINALIICGMQTEMCVQSTTQRALELGYQVTIVADGHTTFDFPDEAPAEAIITQFNTSFASKASVQPTSRITFT